MNSIMRTTLVVVACAVSVEGGFFSRYWDVLSEDECTCNCCIVEPRRPSERNGQVVSKCAAYPAHDQRKEMYQCPKACSVVNDPVLDASSVVEMERFCFYHCQPGNDFTTLHKLNLNLQEDVQFKGGYLEDSVCVPASKNKITQAISSDKSGKDGAFQAGY
eukprot:gnl/TRDRNA2_/TRDRNA2_181399_c0_seq1.p1 gnl/TRDRNA2_/TRDRNA2_181399_c0~~gnl/TRDRNA2_/TRDRNA2_181399_c0_seq1.p1  ORF type:complete len:161 (-),score=21.28 gnl/TRDRNA2_/TRDRNA2_181399_c0_seq1:63-545(-)